MNEPRRHRHAEHTAGVLELPPEPGAASLAIEAVLELLTEAGIDATRDAGAFHPAPVGVLVALPTLLRRQMSSRTFEIPIVVVSGDPLNESSNVDRLYAYADAIAAACSIATYRPSSWAGSANAEPLPAIELTAVVTVTEEV